MSDTTTPSNVIFFTIYDVDTNIYFLVCIDLGYSLFAMLSLGAQRDS